MRGSARTTRSRLAVAVVALLTASLTACTGESSEPPSAADEPSQGGTVKLLTKLSGFTSLDPQAIYVTTDANASRLITRSLTGFTSPDEGESGKLVGDLATDTGKANEDSTEWEFTLREGVKWQSGESVTCEDVRYGVLRSFDVNSDDPEVTGGPPYPTQWLDVPSDYEGPRVDGVDDVPGVTCEGKRTIRFELTESVPDFPRATAMTAFAPVPPDQDEWGDYGDLPVSNGPYQLTKYEPAEDENETGEAVFERNQYWDSETDPIRQAKADKVVVEFGVDPETAAQEIISDNPQYANSAMLGGVPDQFVSQVVNDNELKDQLVTGSTDSVIFMTINTESVSELDCRKALAYAFNKRKFRDVYGGSVFGDYATTMIAPSDPAHRDFDLYGQSSNPDGDYDKAKELLDEADECPEKLTLDLPEGERSGQLAETVQDTYARLGITVDTNEIPEAEFYSTLSHPDEVSDMTMAAWAPDWPGGSGVIPSLFDGDLIKDGLNSNYSLLDDPDINQAIDEAHDQTDTKKAYEQWADIDEMVAEQAAVVPIMYAKVLSLCGPKVRGAHLNPQWGEIDLATLGVAAGS